jgi:hypothetical protein
MAVKIIQERNENRPSRHVIIVINSVYEYRTFEYMATISVARNAIEQGKNTVRPSDGCPH